MIEEVAGTYNYLWEYVRMVCYAIIVLIDLKNIANRKFSTLLYVGDIVMASALFYTVSNIPFTGFRQEDVACRIMTPAAIVWAIIHFVAFLRDNDLTKNSYKSSIKKGII